MRAKLRAARKKLSNYFSNYRHDIFLAITLSFALIVGFCFINSHMRIYEAFRDMWSSLKVFFMIEGTEATVNNVSSVGLGELGIIPEDFEIFKAQIALFGQSLVNGLSWRFYLNELLPLVAVCLQAVLALIVVALIAVLLLKVFCGTTSTDYDDTKAVKKLREFIRLFKRTVGTWLRMMYGFLKEHKAYYIVWILTWAYAFNGFTIVIEFLAYYLYISATLDLTTILIQVYKLLLDLSVLITFFPVWMWCIFGLIIFNIFRHYMAFRKIQKNEDKCEEAVKNFPIASLICGPMGTKKTTFTTEIAITANKLFRQKAYDIIFDNDFKFPDFPWQNLEKSILKGIETHRLYNLASCRRFISQLHKLYELNASGVRRSVYDNSLRRGYDYQYSNYLFGYPEDCKMEFVTESGSESIWSVLENYICAFFIYCISTTMLISNYSIRVDDYIKEDGHFPKWDIDFFRKDKQKTAREHTKYSHILDFDALRLGKRMKANNKMKDSIDFGIVVITEVGKERGNQVTIKARYATLDDGEATQSNDFFTMDIKLCRHRATVDNFPFVLFLMDENRAASLNADNKELCDVTYIAKSSDWNIITTLFAVDELVFEGATKIMKKFYLSLKNKKGGLNLPGYLIKSAYGVLWRHYQKIYRRYSVSSLELHTTDGKEEGAGRKTVYKMSKWKIHNARFTTDALGAFYRYKTGRSRYGIVDIPEYAGLRASLPEMKSEHSFLINDLTNAFIGDDKSDVV